MYHLLETREEFYASLGAGNIVLGEEDLQALRSDKDRRNRSQGWARYWPFNKRKRDVEPAQEKNNKDGDEQPTLVIDHKKPLFLSEENIGRVSMCDVCNPIPGDEVLGYLDEQNRVVIHKRNCSIANRLKNVDGNHILAVFWDTHKQMSFAATLHMEGIDRVGIIKSLTDVITEQLNVNVHQLSIAAREGIFQGDIELGVHDTDDLDVIINNLRKIDGIEDVKRVQ